MKMKYVIRAFDKKTGNSLMDLRPDSFAGPLKDVWAEVERLSLYNPTLRYAVYLITEEEVKESPHD